jgi:hypothetical protein
VRQFLDVGTGLPTADNTHQVAQRVAPESRSCMPITIRSCSRTPGPC